MIIEREEPPFVSLSSLKAGECFLFMDHLYVKVKIDEEVDWNYGYAYETALDLAESKVVIFGNDPEVQKIQAKVVIS